MTVGMGAWFIASNWIYFWTKYMTYGQLGWVDALGFGFALFLEIPSGAIADLFGKRKTIIFGMLAGVLGSSIITFSGSLQGIFIGWMINQFCYTFFSGAGEALLYDTLVDLKEEFKYDKIITKAATLQSFTSVTVTIIGAFAYTYNFRLPHILWTLGFLLSAVAAFFLVEPKIDTIKFSLKKYFSQLSMGFKELTHTSLKSLIAFFFILQGFEFMYSWGFIRPAIATSFGFYSNEQAIIYPIVTLLFAFLVRFVPYLKNKFSDIVGLFYLSLLMGIGFLLAVFPLGIWGVIPMILIPISGSMAGPWISIIVNKRIDSKHRATTLSTVALLARIPYVLAAIAAGRMIEGGVLWKFNLVVGVVVLIVGTLAFVNSFKKKGK